MEPILDKILNPAVIWVIIPVLAIFFWGLSSVIWALRGVRNEPPEWQGELQQLRARVEALERQQGQRTASGDTQVVAASRRD